MANYNSMKAQQAAGCFADAAKRAMGPEATTVMVTNGHLMTSAPNSPFTVDQDLSTGTMQVNATGVQITTSPNGGFAQATNGAPPATYMGALDVSKQVGSARAHCPGMPKP